MPQGWPPPDRDPGAKTIRRLPDEGGELALETPPGAATNGLSLDTSATQAHTPGPSDAGSGGSGGGTGTGTGTGTGGSIVERGPVVVEPGQTIFGKYEVLERLGRGGMGEVWLVRDTELNARRALKMIAHGTAFDSEARARFRREAQAMARFSHPNVVAVHDSRLDRRDVAYIVMEYVPGRSLEKIARPHHPMPLEWVADVLAQLCDALAEAHAQGIIHRDLKPSNLILVDTPKRRDLLKVLDFGIAKILQAEEPGHEAQTMAGAFIGTPPYASPEQATGHAEPSSDIYSVGVMLFEFLTGHRPFTGKSAVLIANTMFTPPPSFAQVNPEANVPPAVEAVVMRCLAKQPADRPHSPTALLEEFREAAGLEPPGGTAETMVRPYSSESLPPASALISSAPASGLILGPRRLSLASVASAALVLVAASAGLAWKLAPGKPPKLAEPVATAATTAPDASKPPVNQPLPRLERDGRWFALAKGPIYLPEGYEAARTSEPPDGAWPAEIVRTRDRVAFARLRAGSFSIGAPPNVDYGNPSNQPAHKVELLGFYIQKDEVTNAQVKDYLAERPELKTDPSAVEWRARFDELRRQLRGDDEAADRHPAAGISWMFAAEFARYRNAYLPTEAQWEYAARSGGLDQPFVWGDDAAENAVGQLAHIDYSEFPMISAEVNKYPRDRTLQGVRDLAGNVREWCGNPFEPYRERPGAEAERQSGPPSPEQKMAVRGGSYLLPSDSRYPAYRSGGLGPAEKAVDLGFRLVVECPDPPSAR